MIDIEQTLINSLKSTVVRSRMNDLNDSEKKVIDSIEKLGDFLESYNDLNQEEKILLGNTIGSISTTIASISIIINSSNF